MALIRYLGNRGVQDTAIEEPDADGSKDMVRGNKALFCATPMCSWHVVAVTENKDWVINTSSRQGTISAQNETRRLVSWPRICCVLTLGMVLDVSRVAR